MHEKEEQKVGSRPDISLLWTNYKRSWILPNVLFKRSVQRVTEERERRGDSRDGGGVGNQRP